jgi:hypothetical protein
MRKRVWILLLAVLLLVGCGGEDQKKNEDAGNSGGGGQTPGVTSTVRPTPTPRGPTPTPREPAPRNQPVPEGDPYAFEVPFSAGSFIRQSLRGNATSERTGGMQAVYQRDQDVLAVTVYYFEQPEQATETVRFVLEGASVIGTVETPYYAPSAAYGVVQVRSGGYMAAWSHYEWAFIIQTGSAVDILNEFLRAFPY